MIPFLLSKAFLSNDSPKLAIGKEMLVLTVHMVNQPLRHCDGVCVVYSVYDNEIIAPDKISLPREPVGDATLKVGRGWRQNMDVLRVLGHFENSQCYGEQVTHLTPGIYSCSATMKHAIAALVLHLCSAFMQPPTARRDECCRAYADAQDASHRSH